MSQKGEKPTLSGQRIKTRKRGMYWWMIIETIIDWSDVILLGSFSENFRTNIHRSRTTLYHFDVTFQQLADLMKDSLACMWYWYQRYRCFGLGFCHNPEDHIKPLTKYQVIPFGMHIHLLVLITWYCYESAMYPTVLEIKNTTEK